MRRLASLALVLVGCASSAAPAPAPAPAQAPGPAPATAKIMIALADADVALVERLCDDGDHGACTELGERLRLGSRGAPHDLSRAFAVLDASCTAQRGVGPACTHLAEFYLQALGGAPDDDARGVWILRTACDGGVLDACRYLGLVFVEGLASPTIPYRKDAWLDGMAIWERACAQGHARSCASAAERYRGGFPLGADPTKAAALEARACQLDAERCAGR